VALANEPDLLLADEVTGQLDSETAEQVMEAIVATGRRHGLTVLFVTHDDDLASRAQRRLVLEDGRVHER
jgi:putative ABC transport system ATP-binding protein